MHALGAKWRGAMMANIGRRERFALGVWALVALVAPALGQPDTAAPVTNQRPVANGGVGYYASQWQRSSTLPALPAPIPAPGTSDEHEGVVIRPVAGFKMPSVGVQPVLPEREVPGIRPVAGWQREAAPESATGRLQPLDVQFSQTLPPDVTRLNSDEVWRQRLQADAARAGKAALPFPRDAPLPADGPPRMAVRKQRLIEPHYVCYCRLPFEQTNSERFGWELGPIQPVASAGVFFADLVASPLCWLRDPLRTWECSSGQCLPGDPVPYLLYLPCLDLSRLNGAGSGGR